MPITEIQDHKMPSFTEWFESIGYKNTAEFRAEDNSKRDRLEILYQEIGLPYDRPERMTTRDITECTPLFQDIVNRKGNELCALRLVPINPQLPKYRQRGKTLNEYLNGWFNTLNINPSDYKVEVVPHGETKFSATLIVTDKKIIGEIVRGGHWQLTQGFFEKKPVLFAFDFNELTLTDADEEIKTVVKNILEFLIIPENKRPMIIQKINGEFTDKGYLKGYFEFILTENDKKMFVDYNRLIPNLIGELDFPLPNEDSNAIGICASPGQATGRAKFIPDPAQDNGFANGDILICPMTTIDYVPLMKKAGAIITEQGNILSHASIVARELKKPCLVGAKNIRELVKEGEMIKIDADKCEITKL